MECPSRCLLVVALWTLVAAGCGSGDNAGTSSNFVKDVPPPESTVKDFLEAVRTGNDSKVELLLTELARQETKKYELEVAPPGSDTAKFEVGSVEIVAEGLAHVASKWTDIGDDGQPHTDEIIWMLRRDPAGWRIAGMATKLFKDELPLLLDFEDPKEMMRKQELAEQEMARRLQNAAGVQNPAIQPQVPPQSSAQPQRNVLRQ